MKDKVSELTPPGLMCWSLQLIEHKFPTLPALPYLLQVQRAAVSRTVSLLNLSVNKYKLFLKASHLSTFN